MAIPLSNLVKNVASTVSVEEFRGLLDFMFSRVPSRAGQLRNASRIAIAVSGGPDSLALLSLARRVYSPDQIVAIFVNHGLAGMGVTEYEERVKGLITQLGVGVQGHSVSLEWGEGSELEKLNKGALQERARNKRYQALLKACAHLQTPLLLTGHTLDDDIITMFYRFSHGSGLDGIAGMKMLSPFPISDVRAGDFWVGRPLLSIPKERLLKTCEEQSLPWTIDDSNSDRHYQRNNITAALQEILNNSGGKDEKGVLQLRGEELVDMLNTCKEVARDIQGRINQLFSNSIFIDRRIGDATLILASTYKPHTLSLLPAIASTTSTTVLKNPPMVISRAIGLMGQYVAARSTPVKTRRMQDIQSTLQAAWLAHQQEQARREQTIKARVRGILPPTQLLPYERARRVTVGQMTFGGAIMLSLGRDDALRRVNRFSKLLGRKLEAGPAFLIQREPPSRVDNQKSAFLPVKACLAPEEWYLWDDRLYLSYKAGSNQAEIEESGLHSLQFIISYLTMADVREFERLTANTPLFRRPLYAYLGITPASHLYQVPVVRIQGDPNYMAFPTINVQYPVDTLTWNTKHAGDALLMAKLECLP